MANVINTGSNSCRNSNEPVNKKRKAVCKHLTDMLNKPLNPDTYKKLSREYKKLKEYNKAIKHLEKAKKISMFDSEIYYELGLNYLLCSNFDEARCNFIKTIKLNPHNLNAQLQLAIVHELLDEADMALLIYDKIIEEKPDFIVAYNHKAGLYMQLKDYLEAAKIFHAILKIDPYYYRANLGLGICFDKLDMHTKAVRFYKKYIAQKPESETTKSIVGRIVDIYSDKKQRQSGLKLIGQIN